MSPEKGLYDMRDDSIIAEIEIQSEEYQESMYVHIQRYSIILI